MVPVPPLKNMRERHNCGDRVSLWRARADVVVIPAEAGIQ
jgi:hypothetical protein